MRANRIQKLKANHEFDSCPQLTRQRWMSSTSIGAPGDAGTPLPPYIHAFSALRPKGQHTIVMGASMAQCCCASGI